MLLELKDITKYFYLEQGIFRKANLKICALDHFNLSIAEFESVGLVGGSGSGKTTLAKIILNLISPTSGEASFNRAVIQNPKKDIQIIFQNPYNSLDPRMKIGATLSEPLLIHRVVSAKKLPGRLQELLDMVGLEADMLERYPFEFSGGQRQRICLARALATEPKFLVLDEPLSSLDLIVQAEMLDLLLKLKEKFRLTYLFITHNLALVRYLTDKVVVLQEGRKIEEGNTQEVFSRPQQTYTQLLIKAASGG